MSSSRFTLPRLDFTVDRSREPLSVEFPTWARRSNGAGQFERLRLHRSIDTVAADGTRTEVWVVPATATSPGDRIEVGPTPGNVRIDIEVIDPYAIAAAFTPTPSPDW